jgi:tetratricopeptide (TPR) repeat protein
LTPPLEYRRKIGAIELRAELLEELGDHQGAVADYSQAIAIYPKYKALWLARTIKE